MHKTLTCALDTISNPARAAATFEASCCVCTYGMSVTVMGSNFTLIDICKQRCLRSSWNTFSHIHITDNKISQERQCEHESKPAFLYNKTFKKEAEDKITTKKSKEEQRRTKKSKEACRTFQICCPTHYLSS